MVRGGNPRNAEELILRSRRNVMDRIGYIAGGARLILPFGPEEEYNIYIALSKIAERVNKLLPFDVEFIGIPVGPLLFDIKGNVKDIPKFVPFLRAFISLDNNYFLFDKYGLTEPFLLMNDFLRMATLMDICRTVKVLGLRVREVFYSELGIDCSQEPRPSSIRGAPFPRPGYESKYIEDEELSWLTEVPPIHPKVAIVPGPLNLSVVRKRRSKLYTGAGTPLGVYSIYPVRVPEDLVQLEGLTRTWQFANPDRRDAITYIGFHVGYVKVLVGYPEKDPDAWKHAFVPFIWAPADWRKA